MYGATSPRYAALQTTIRLISSVCERTGPHAGLCVHKRLEADALGEQLAVVGGIAEQELGRLRSLEVEVRRVLPREADAAVDLDVLGGGVEVGVRAVRLGQAGDGGELLVQLGRGPARVVG